MKALRISLERQARFQVRFLEVLKQGRLLDAASYRWIFERNGTDEVAEGFIFLAGVYYAILIQK